MAEPKVKAWTDTEKVGLLFHIIEKSGPIPWDTIQLPEGRTLKACQVMIDKEKQKVRKAGEAAGEVIETPKGKGKRKAEGETETPASSAKKTKGRKRAEKKDGPEDGEEAIAEESPAKAEPAEDKVSS